MLSGAASNDSKLLVLWDIITDQRRYLTEHNNGSKVIVEQIVFEPNSIEQQIRFRHEIICDKNSVTDTSTCLLSTSKVHYQTKIQRWLLLVVLCVLVCETSAHNTSRTIKFWTASYWLEIFIRNNWSNVATHVDYYKFPYQDGTWNLKK